MKKVVLVFLVILMFTLTLVPIGAESTQTEKTYDLLVDFNTVESIAAYSPNGSSTVGLQSLLTISENVALVKDGDTQVLYYPKTNTETYGGFNMQPVPTAASNYIFYSFEIKVAKLTEGGLVTLGYVDLAKKWVYGWGIIGTANGNGELVCDLNMNHDKTKPSAYDHYTTLASLEKDRYYTVTIKYDLLNQKQSIYLDGVELSSEKGFVNEAPLDKDSHSYEGNVTIQTPMRCVLFHMYQGEYECYYRKIAVYSSQSIDVPYEYVIPTTELDTFKDNAKADLENTVKLDDYRDAQKTEIQTIITEGKAAIDAATDNDTLNAALNNAKAKLAAVKTDAQLKVEEALAAKKASTKEQLDALVNLSDYSEKNQTEIRAILAQGKNDVDAQDSEDGVNRVFSTVKNRLMDFATLSEEALENKKTTAKAELNSFVDTSALEATVKSAVEAEIRKGEDAIDEAEDEAGVDAALTAAKNAIQALLPETAASGEATVASGEATVASGDQTGKGCKSVASMSFVLLLIPAVGLVIRKKKEYN